MNCVAKYCLLTTHEPGSRYFEVTTIFANWITLYRTFCFCCVSIGKAVKGRVSWNMIMYDTLCEIHQKINFTFDNVEFK